MSELEERKRQEILSIAKDAKRYFANSSNSQELSYVIQKCIVHADHRTDFALGPDLEKEVSKALTMENL